MNINKDFLNDLVNQTSANFPAASAYDTSSDNRTLDVEFKAPKTPKRVALISHVRPDIYVKIEKLSVKNNCSKSHIVEKILEKFLG